MVEFHYLVTPCYPQAKKLYFFHCIIEGPDLGTSRGSCWIMAMGVGTLCRPAQNAKEYYQNPRKNIIKLAKKT